MSQIKVQSLNNLKRIRARLRREGKSVVFTNGCFDLIHGGHIHLFKKAKSSGDVLIVALNTDASIRKLKGPARPVFPLKERFEVLSAIEDVDYLTSFAEETPQKIIGAILPDVLVKGGDWKVDQVVGRKEVEAAGGRIVIVPFLKGRSSTTIIKKILKNFS
jgi:D-beta-D-heptose 7-phosphate kinase/D-beta-D-heptose 1-phosphate adenosyltransferase